MAQAGGLLHDQSGSLALAVYFGDQNVIGERRGKRRISRWVQQRSRGGTTWMKVPTTIDFNAINRVLLLHGFRVVRIDVAADVVSPNDLRVTHALQGLNRWRQRDRTENRLRARNAGSDKHKRDESEIFHGFMGVEGD